MIDHPVRDQIPVFVAATGPRDVENVARAWREAGVTVLNVAPAGPDTGGTLRQIREWI